MLPVNMLRKFLKENYAEVGFQNEVTHEVRQFTDAHSRNVKRMHVTIGQLRPNKHLSPKVRVR
jgi:hypothetical protein